MSIKQGCCDTFVQVVLVVESKVANGKDAFHL